MKIKFKDQSHVECIKNDQGKIFIIIAAKDQNNPQKKITNAVELTIEEFKKLISDI